MDLERLAVDVAHIEGEQAMPLGVDVRHAAGIVSISDRRRRCTPTMPRDGHGRCFEGAMDSHGDGHDKLATEDLARRVLSLGAGVLDDDLCRRTARAF